MAITPLMPVYPRSEVRPVRGEGVYLYGEQGEKYLDFAAGIAVNLLGHGHPHLTKALQEQIARLVNVLETHMHAEGFNIGLNLGRVAGAGLPGHLHWHVVPRWHGDTNFMPVLDGIRVIPQSLDALWELLAGALASKGD